MSPLFDIYKRWRACYRFWMLHACSAERQSASDVRCCVHSRTKCKHLNVPKALLMEEILRDLRLGCFIITNTVDVFAIFESGRNVTPFWEAVSTFLIFFIKPKLIFPRFSDHGPAWRLRLHHQGGSKNIEGYLRMTWHGLFFGANEI